MFREESCSIKVWTNVDKAVLAEPGTAMVISSTICPTALLGIIVLRITKYEKMQK